MAVVLAVLCGLASGYCLVRCVVPRWRTVHGVGVDAWHVAMGAAMVAMLVAPVGSGSAAVQAAAFGIAALWCACHLLARNRSGAHARLGVACAVMAAMLLPAAVAVPASAAPVPEHHQMAGMDMSGSAPMPAGMVMPPTWLSVAMLLALVGVVVAALVAARRPACHARGARLGLACEVVMAGAMGYMAALAL